MVFGKYLYKELFDRYNDVIRGVQFNIKKLIAQGSQLIADFAGQQRPPIIMYVFLGFQEAIF